MNERRKQLLSDIEEAFRGVQLGDGVSLHETIVIDHHGDAKQRKAARENDEQHDWQQLVTDPELARIDGVGGLCFFDPAGFKFHLPAYLSVATTESRQLDGTGVLWTLIQQLTCFDEYHLNRFALLDSPQRQCVGKVLSLIRDDYSIYDDIELDSAIRGFWAI